MRNRLLLAGLIVGAWLALKVIDIFVPWPAILFLLFVTLIIMIMHSTWLYLAQFRWRKRLVKQRRAEQRLARERRAEERAAEASGLSPTATIEEEPEETWEPWVDIFIAAKNES